MNTNPWTSAILGLAAYVAAGYASGNPVGDAPVDPQLEAAYQLEITQLEQDWRLDPTVFTEISPVSIPEVAIKLPEDQEDDG